MKTSETNILNNTISLVEIPKSEVAGVPAGIRVGCNFYRGCFLGEEYVFVSPKGLKLTPNRCSWAAKEVNRVLGRTAVFILPIGPNYERQRLLEKGVFFVMIAELVPYSYESVTLGITCMADLAICEKVAVGPKSKAIHFSFKGRELWEKALQYAFNPVDETFYCDEYSAAADYPICGVNALANYSHLNPDKEDWRMLTAKEYRNCLTTRQLVRQNPFDGNVIIEVWKYPAVAGKSKPTEYVDRLSLVLSLIDNQDPRIEGEIEYLIDTFPWKD